MNLKKTSRSASTVATLLVCFLAFNFFAGKFAPAESVDESTTKLICEMLTRHHISHPVINDEVSKKVFHQFIESLDGQKQYFYKSDLDQLMKHEFDLDDQLKTGNVEFAYTTFNLYKKRINERIEYALKLVSQPHDFSVDEYLVTDGKNLDWANSKEELNDRWRKRIKYDILNIKLGNEKTIRKNAAEQNKTDEPAKKIEDPVERLTKRYNRLRTNLEQTQDFEVFEMYIGALTHSLDPHTSYMSPQTLEDFQIQMSLKLEGIGASLRSEDGLTVVHRIIPGGAADKDKRIEAGDKIIRVGQEGQTEDQFEDIREMKLSRVVRFIRGTAGTKVQLEIEKGKSGDIVVYTLTRQQIELKEEAVKGEVIDLGERIPGAKGRIGIIDIPSFYRDFSGARNNPDSFRSTAKDVLKVLRSFQKQGNIDGIVIDLRDNGGGSLTEAIDVSGLFIDKGPVVQIKNKNEKVSVQSDENEGSAYRGPLVVVCNRLSASASEIFAGVIKDYERGVIIGDETTHGKGTVQNVMPVQETFFGRPIGNPNGALKLTINQFYRVNGHSTQNRGVESDVVLPSILDHGELGEKYLDNALAFDEVPVAKHTKLGFVKATEVQTLQARSSQRVGQSEKFNKDLRDIARFEKRKNRKQVTLNEAALRKERQEETEEDLAAAKEDELEEGDEPVFKDGYYNNEVLQVALDYVNILRERGKQTAAK